MFCIVVGPRRFCYPNFSLLLSYDNAYDQLNQVSFTTLYTTYDAPVGSSYSLYLSLVSRVPSMCYSNKVKF